MIGQTKKFRGSRRKILVAGLLFWAVFSSFLALPSLNSTKSNERSIAEIGARIGELSRWSGSRASPDSSIAQWQMDQDQRFERLFPKKKEVELLLYRLARSANRCGIDPLHVQLKEKIAKRRKNRREDSGTAVAGGMDEHLMAQLGLGLKSFPGNKVQASVLQLQFEADFEALTRYLEEIRDLPRAMNVNALHLNEGANKIRVEMELEYYVQSPR